MAEWSNAPDSKSGSRVSRDVGSNPTLSASESAFETKAGTLVPSLVGATPEAQWTYRCGARLRPVPAVAAGTEQRAVIGGGEHLTQLRTSVDPCRLRMKRKRLRLSQWPRRCEAHTAGALLVWNEPEPRLLRMHRRHSEAFP